MYNVTLTLDTNRARVGEAVTASGIVTFFGIPVPAFVTLIVSGKPAAVTVAGFGGRYSTPLYLGDRGVQEVRAAIQFPPRVGLEVAGSPAESVSISPPTGIPARVSPPTTIIEIITGAAPEQREVVRERIERVERVVPVREVVAVPAPAPVQPTVPIPPVALPPMPAVPLPAPFYLVDEEVFYSPVPLTPSTAVVAYGDKVSLGDKNKGIVEKPKPVPTSLSVRAEGTIAPNTIHLYQGQTKDLSAVAYYSDGTTKQVSAGWSVEDPKVVAVDYGGTAGRIQARHTGSPYKAGTTVHAEYLETVDGERKLFADSRFVSVREAALE